MKSIPGRIQLDLDGNDKVPEEEEYLEESDQGSETRDMYARNDPTLDPKDKSYLAQYHYGRGGGKPTLPLPGTNGVESPVPLDVTKGDYVDAASRQDPGYNLDFEPHASVYGDKLIVDPDNN